MNKYLKGNKKMVDIKSANGQVTELYNQLKPIINSIVDKNAKSLDDIIKKVKNNLTTLTNKEIQDIILQLSIETYYFSTIKDMSILKQECSIALMKEKQASVYNGTDGTQATRNNQAVMETLDKQTVQILYNAVSNCMKSKLDEAHRIVNMLSSVLISRNAEAKLKGVPDNDIHNNFNESD